MVRVVSIEAFSLNQKMLHKAVCRVSIKFGGTISESISEQTY